MCSSAGLCRFGPTQMARLVAVILLVAEFLLMFCRRVSRCLSKRRLASGNLLATLWEQEHSLNPVDIVSTRLPGSCHPSPPEGRLPGHACSTAEARPLWRHGHLLHHCPSGQSPSASGKSCREGDVVLHHVHPKPQPTAARSVWRRREETHCISGWKDWSFSS